jgi:hypothetical protein
MSKLILSPVVKTKENRRWDWTPTLIMPEEQLMVCPQVKCGKSFNKPIKLTVRVDGSLETYYACPHCFSRVKTLETVKNNVAGCAHYVGYLKTRPKDSPIPDKCLTCSRILQCM